MTDLYSIDSHKIHYHPTRINQWLSDGANTFPLYVEISPVGHCNHRCTFCAVDYIGYKPRSIETNRFKDVLSNMSLHGIKSVMFAGEGEPLLHKQLPEIINHTKRVGIDVAITTNGVLANEQFINECLYSVDWIKVSMNGGSKSYQQIHKSKDTDYQTVWHNIKRAIEHKKFNRLKTVIGIQTLLLSDNIQDIHELAHKSRAAGLDYLVVKPYSQHFKSLTTTYKDIHYYEKQYVDIVYELEIYNTDTFKIISRKNSMEAWDSSDRGYHKCYSTPYFWAYIMATGDVYGCSAYLLDDKFCYGNINQQQFSDIWLGDKRKKSIEYVANQLDISQCRKNCRMDKVNKYLWELKNPVEHANFI